MPTQGTSLQKTTTTVDALGRLLTQQISDGPTTYSIVKTQYDPLGRPYMTSNPYTSSPSNWTTTQFDVLGRPTKVILPDGSSQTTYSYATNTFTVTDPAGKARKSVLDGLGRFTQVFEDPSALNYETDYAYDIFDLPTGVTQGAQARTYVYDDLRRLTSVKTPETNQVPFSFQYNNFGLVTQRTDARGVITTYGYDTLNRLQSISYNVGGTGVPATASVTLAYGVDSSCNAAHGAGCIGRLITMTDGVGSENYTYNNLGELTQLQKVISGTTYTLGYSYNLAGELKSIAYPSGRNVQQNLDNIGRLSSIVGTLNSIDTTYASGFVYNPAQQVTGFNYGNNINAAFGYTSDLLLLSCLDYSTTARNGNCAHDATTKFGLSYSYPAVGSNNGLIAGITDNTGTEEAGRSVTFSYDALYRLASAVTTGSTNYPKWGLTWAYDRYGNRLNQTQTYGNPPQNSLSFANPGGAQTNRPDNMCFDANGNLMTETSVSPCPPSNPTYTYDAENSLVSYMGSSATYTFDGNGLRVKKAASGTTTVYIFSGSKVIAEYDNGAAPSSPSREYIYSGTTLLAKIEGGGTMYYHPDHLSNRVLTDSSGNVLGQRGHFPFGDTWYETGTTTNIKFTTYEHDNESSNDYAVARTYINRFGRFPSMDPIAGSFGDPQSLNRYTYGRNVPTIMIDPSGLSPGCKYLKNFDSTNPSEVAGGPSAENSHSDPPEPDPQACPPGGSGGSGYPIGGGDIFDILWAWTWIPGSGEQDHQVFVLMGDPSGILGFGPGDPGGTLEDAIKKAVEDCVKEIFKVNMTAYTQSQRGQNGSFTGTTSNGQSITITNDVNRFSIRDLNVIAYTSPTPPKGRGDIEGMTREGPLATKYFLGLWGYAYQNFDLHTNYTARDTSPASFMRTQWHELGHSLAQLLKLAPVNSEDSYAGKLEDCINRKRQRKN